MSIWIWSFRSTPLEVFLRKDVLKICGKFTGGHPCRSTISIKLQSNFTEIALGHGCSPVNVMHIIRIPFPQNTSWRLLLIRQMEETLSLDWKMFTEKDLFTYFRETWYRLYVVMIHPLTWTWIMILLLLITINLSIIDDIFMRYKTVLKICDFVTFFHLQSVIYRLNYYWN